MPFPGTLAPDIATWATTPDCRRRAGVRPVTDTGQRQATTRPACGVYSCPTNGRHAYLKTVSDPVVDLPELPAMKEGGKNYSATRTDYACALNNATPLQIIGSAHRTYTKGVFDTSSVRVVDLRTVTDGSPDLYSVGDINDAGWITSCTRNAGGGPESPVVLIPSR